MNEEVQEVYNDHLKGLTARQIWGNPIREATLKAVLIKLRQPLEKDGCLKCLSDGLAFVFKEVHKMKKTVSKYKMKSVTIAKLGFKLNNDNLTDDLARKLLLKDESLIKFFDKYPKNWKEDLRPKPKLIKKDKPVNNED